MKKETKKYKPQNAKVQSWDEIEKHFTEWFSGTYVDNLAKLVGHIKSSGLSQRLFGYISMNKLIVSIYNPIEWNREALHIEFDKQNQNWYFKYYPKPNEKVEFERKYELKMGIEKFEKFIEMMKW